MVLDPLHLIDARAFRYRVSGQAVAELFNGQPGLIHAADPSEQVRPNQEHGAVQAFEAAIAAGARHATHFYDVFPVPPETEPGARPVGAVEAFLADPAATVDFIADGCHVDPLASRLAVRAKTCAGVAVITDGNIGAGLPPGDILVWELEIPAEAVPDTPYVEVKIYPGVMAQAVEGLEKILRMPHG